MVSSTFLTACLQLPVKEEVDDIRSQIIAQKKEITSTSKTSGVSKPKKISYPDNHLWLEEATHHQIASNTSAYDAVLALAGERPVRFDIKQSVESFLTQAKLQPKSGTIFTPGATQGSQAKTKEAPLVTLNGRYTLRKAFDAIASQADWVWEIDKGTIVVKNTLLKTISFPSIPGVANSTFSPELKTQVDSGNAGIGTGNQQVGSNNQGGANDSYTIKTDTYKDLKETVNLIAARLGVSVSISPSANLISVIGKPSAVSTAAALINAHKDQINRAVLLDVAVLSVNKSIERDLGVDITTVENIFDFDDVNLSQVSLANGILSVGTSEGSQAVINALFRKGATQVLNKPSIIVPNNQAVTITEDNNVVNFLRSVSTQTTGIGGIAEQNENIQVGRIAGGTTVKAIASIADEKISLRLNYQQIGNITFDSVTAGTVSLNLPSFTNSSLDIPAVSINDGETIVLGGLTETSYTSDITTNPALPFIADDRVKNKNERELYIVITARIVK